MELKPYFENAKGTGVLATSDAEGRVGIAIFARPHVLDDGTVAFIMPARGTLANLQTNPHAAYLFTEDRAEGGDWAGARLYLTKVGEEQDTERLKSLRRRTYDDDRQGRYLVIFQVDRVLPLLGSGE